MGISFTMYNKVKTIILNEIKLVSIKELNKLTQYCYCDLYDILNILSEERYIKLDKYNSKWEKVNYSDKEIEKIWKELEDITFIENNDSELILNSDYFIWNSGETQENIWKWFDKNHSQYLYYLMYVLD